MSTSIIFQFVLQMLTSATYFFSFMYNILALIVDPFDPVTIL